MRLHALSLLITFFSLSILSCGQENSLRKMKNFSANSEPAQDFLRRRDKIWSDLREGIKNDEARKASHQRRKITYNGSIMRFSMNKIGPKPAGGYPLYIALHGGGATSKKTNDAQWNHMKVYYRSSIKNGIYVAVRGISDNWNLHFEDDSYPLYDRLIENMIAFEEVDPDRVYLLGFSAGGDGVYQITTRMADRFAAANMSAGHANGISFENLSNTPFLMQMGAKDSSYDRNQDIVFNHKKFSELRNTYQSFVFDSFIHPGKGHNGWPDNKPKQASTAIIRDPVQWLENRDVTVKEQDTNAVRWVSRYKRSTLVSELVWNLSTRAPRKRVGEDQLGEARLAAPEDLFYWLKSPEKNAKGFVHVTIKKETNTIEFVSMRDIKELHLLLSPQLLDLESPIIIKSQQGLRKVIAPPCSDETIRSSLLERGDPSLAYCSVVKISFL